MNGYARYLWLLSLLLTASILNAQEEKRQKPSIELLGAGDVGFMAIIQDSRTTRTPLSKLLPRTRCGSLEDCTSLADHLKHTDADWASEATPGNRIWVIEVKPKEVGRDGEDYDPKASYTFKLLEIADCGPGDLCPDIGPGPVDPIPEDPDCGLTDVCPDPGPGQAILGEINRGHLKASKEIPLNWSSRRYVRRLINATEQGAEDKKHP